MLQVAGEQGSSAVRCLFVWLDVSEAVDEFRSVGGPPGDYFGDTRTI